MYFQHIKLPFEHDFSQLAVWDDDPKNFGYSVRDANYLGQPIIDCLKERGVYFAHVALFHTPPRGFLPIHTDTYILPNFAKLNFVYGGQASSMQWYKLKPGYVLQPVITDDQKKYRTPTGSDVAYVSIPGGECTLAARTRIGTPTLINAGQPHSVLNNTDEHRWCISVPLRSLVDDHKLEFSEAAELLKDLWA